MARAFQERDVQLAGFVDNRLGPPERSVLGHPAWGFPEGVPFEFEDTLVGYLNKKLKDKKVKNREFLKTFKNQFENAKDFSLDVIPHFMGKIFTYKTATKVVDIGSTTNYNQLNNSF